MFLSPELGFDDILVDLEKICDSMIEEHQIEDYYFNLYKVEEPYVRFGLRHPSAEAVSRLELLHSQLRGNGKIIRVDQVGPDLEDVDGIEMDEVKCLARALSKRVINRLGANPTLSQSGYLIHLMMNQLRYTYNDEIELYSSLEKSISTGKRNLNPAS